MLLPAVAKPSHTTLRTISHSLGHTQSRPQSHIFEIFHIESKHDNNEILMEINLDLLVQALRSAQHSDCVTVRLTKKNNTPFLTLDIELVWISSLQLLYARAR